MSDKKSKPETATDEVLHEFEEAELSLDDGEPDEHDREAADALSPSRTAQESARQDKQTKQTKHTK